MRIVYLDQNKWIELARGAKGIAEHDDLWGLLPRIQEAVNAGKLRLPLTFANIYETQKVNDPDRRRDLALVQAALSGGLVIRARHSRLRVEVRQFLAETCGIALQKEKPKWFLSNVFFEAGADLEAVRKTSPISDQAIAYIRCNPQASLFEYLINTPDDLRSNGVRNFTAGSERLRAAVEERRGRHAGTPMAMRRRIYSAILMFDDLERILSIANEVGLPWRGIEDIGETIARRLINEVPTYHVEREIALRLETQNRPIEENDFRDMQSFCAAIPYSDLVVGEKQFVNLAIQAGLGRAYATRLETDARTLWELLDGV